MPITEFSLEIYMPGSRENLWVTFSSNTPFMAIHAGDIINPNTWEGSQSPMKVLRATGIEHIIWETNGAVRHKIMIYTEEVDN